MNIVIQDTQGAHHFQHIGWAKAFTYAGNNVVLWNPAEKSILDLFNEIDIDIFFGQLYNVDRAQIKAFYRQPDCKLILKAGDFGPINYPDWDSNKYPVLLASPEEKKNAELLKDRISFLHIHYHPDNINDTHGYWLRDYGLKTISSLNCADIFDYTNGQYIQDIASDIIFIGNYWKYKSLTLDKYLLKLCNPNLNLNLKIFGSGWNIPQYCGVAPNEIVKHLFSSSTICPSISELHSQDFGYDCIERGFKLLSNKSFCIHDSVSGMRKLFPDGMEFASTPEEFVEKTFYYLKNPEKRLPFIKAGYQECLSHHTIFDRAYQFFDNLGFTKEAESTIMMKKQVISELNL